MASTYSLRRIADLKPGDHLCSLYETEEAHRALLTPFLRQGLERGEKVLYIVDAHPAETILGYLRDDGLKVEPYLASGQLSILTASDTYMREGVFDPDGMIALLRAETERALAESYSALRLTGETSWALRELPGSERLIEYEARLNEFFPDSKCLALCQYDRRRFDPAVLSDVLCTHPIAVIGTTVYDTFYYIPPAEFLSHDPSAAKLHHWLNHLAERNRAEEALKRRLEQLAGLNRASQAVTASLELDQVLAEIVSLASEVAASDYAGVVMVDEEGRLSRSAEHLPDVPDIGSHIRAEGFTHWIVRSRQAVVVDEIDEDGTVHPRPANGAPCTVSPPVTEAGVKSFVGLPLVAKDRLLGALFLYSLHPGNFRDQLPLLTTFANQAAVAIENAHLYEGVSKRLAQISSLQTVSTAMVSTLELEKLLELIVEQATNLLGGEGGVLNMCDLDQNTEEVVATAGLAKPVQGFKDSPEDTLSGWVTVHNQPLICSDLAADPRASRRGVEAMKARTAILAPLGVKEQVIGSLVVLDKEKSKGRFNQDDLDLLVAFANQAAVAIENARLHQEVQHRVEELVFLNRVGRTVTSSLNLEQVLMAILEEAALMLRTEASSILLFDEESSELVFKAAFGGRSEEAKDLRLPLGQGIAGWVAREGQPLLVPDVREDPRFYSGIDQVTGFVTRSVLGVPLEVKEKVIGVIEVVNKTEGDFGQADVELLSSMAQSAAIAIENARLYKDLQDRMEELERTQAQLIQSAKLAAIGELAAGVAHELNNPLTSIMGLTSLLLQRMDDNAPMKEDLQIIEQAAARTKTIVRGLLDFARQTESRLELADVNEIVQSTMALLRHQAKVARVTVKESYDENLPLVSLDANQIKQVFLNIITNAIQAMPQGGELEVVTSYRPRAIDGTDCVAVEFHDAGTGISAENLPRIFDPFFTTKKAGQGTGLGLSISHGIVEKHGGKIEVESEMGQGSTFTVLLPVAEGRRES